MHRKRAEDLGDFEKSQLELSSWLRRRRLTFASSPKPGRWPCGGCSTRFGADGKSSIERLCLSPYGEKPFNSKVIKRFVPEPRSRKCFSCFGIPMFDVYMLWTFYVRFTYPYIFMYGYVTVIVVVALFTQEDYVLFVFSILCHFFLFLSK